MIGSKRIGVNRDWRLLQAVVGMLWFAACLTLIVVHYAAKPQDDIVLTAKSTPPSIEAIPVHLAGSAAQ